MGINEMTLREVMERGLTWEDFGDRKEILKPIMFEAYETNEITEAYRIACYLDEKMEKIVFRSGQMHPLSFYLVELTDFARMDIAKGKAPQGFRSKGAVCYEPDYSNMDLLIEDVGEQGVYAVYMKDYGFGYMKPFGECIYDLEEEYVEAFNAGKVTDSESGIERVLLPYLEEKIVSGEIDLEEEFYGYYHDIPEIKIPGMEKRLNEDLVTVKEASEMLGVSAARVKKMVADRVLDGFKRNGKVWISKAEVQSRIDYIAEHGKPKRGRSAKANRK